MHWFSGWQLPSTREPFWDQQGVGKGRNQPSWASLQRRIPLVPLRTQWCSDNCVVFVFLLWFEPWLPHQIACHYPVPGLLVSQHRVQWLGILDIESMSPRKINIEPNSRPRNAIKLTISHIFSSMTAPPSPAEIWRPGSGAMRSMNLTIAWLSRRRMSSTFLPSISWITNVGRNPKGWYLSAISECGVVDIWLYLNPLYCRANAIVRVNVE